MRFVALVALLALVPSGARAERSLARLCRSIVVAETDEGGTPSCRVAQRFHGGGVTAALLRVERDVGASPVDLRIAIRTAGRWRVHGWVTYVHRGHGMWGTLTPMSFELRDVVPGGGDELRLIVRRWQGEPATTGCAVVRGVIETVEAVCSRRGDEGWRCGQRVVASGAPQERRLFDDECRPPPWTPPVPWRARMRFDQHRAWLEPVEGEPPNRGPWPLDQFFPIPED